MQIRKYFIYIAIETTGAMRGECIASVKNALEVLIAKLRQDPYALEAMEVKVFGFNRKVYDIAPLSALETVEIPEIECKESTPPFTGNALRYISQEVELNLLELKKKNERYNNPILFLFTRGKPADKQLLRTTIQLVKGIYFYRIAVFIAGNGNYDQLFNELTDEVYMLDNLDYNDKKLIHYLDNDDELKNYMPFDPTSELITRNLPQPPKEIKIYF